jgi:hypothetical protein
VIGIVLRASDKQTQLKARKAKLEVTISDDWEMPYERNLFVLNGVELQWDLLDAGFHFVERWDAAAPMWRYGILAKDLGGPDEQERTKLLTKDLRIPVYAPELLFVRNSEAGQQLLQVWRAECSTGKDEKLAFLRALCLVKPMFLPLPANWLRVDAATVAAQLAVGIEVQQEKPRRPAMVHLEVAPGRYVCCSPGQEEVYRERFLARRKRRNVSD